MRIAVLAVLGGHTLLAGVAPGAASGQEVAPPRCDGLHSDPGRYQPSVGLERAVQRLMRPRLDGSQRSPKAISRLLQRQGFKVGYSRLAEDVPGNTTAVVAEGADLTSIVLVYAQILFRGGGTCTRADGSTYPEPRAYFAYPEPYMVRARARIQLIPQSCLRRDQSRRASLPSAYLRAARRLMAPRRDGRRRAPELIAALLTRDGYPTLPVSSNMDLRELSLRIDQSTSRRLVVVYQRETCVTNPNIGPRTLTLTTTIRP